MTQSMTSRLAVCMALLITASCASSDYHLEKDGIGYSEEQISEKVYSVSFHGDKTTPQETVENMLLLRMAELTRDADMDYFTVVLDDTICETKVQTSPTTTCTYKHSTADNFAYTSLTETLLSDVGLVSKEYESRATFIMGKGVLVSDPTDSHVASEVIEELGCLKTPKGCAP